MLSVCPTLCNPVDCSPPGSSLHGIFQTRSWKGVAISLSRKSYWPSNWPRISWTSYVGRQILYHCTTWEAKMNIPSYLSYKWRKWDLNRIIKFAIWSWASLLAQKVKNLPEMQETWVWSLDRDDPLEEGMATHSSILAWRIPWTEEPGGLQSVGSQRVRHGWMTEHSMYNHPN